jgi:hypothetical protein
MTPHTQHTQLSWWLVSASWRASLRSSLEPRSERRAWPLEPTFCAAPQSALFTAIQSLGSLGDTLIEYAYYWGLEFGFSSLSGQDQRIARHSSGCSCYSKPGTRVLIDLSSLARTWKSQRVVPHGFLSRKSRARITHLKPTMDQFHLGGPVTRRGGIPAVGTAILFYWATTRHRAHKGISTGKRVALCIPRLPSAPAILVLKLVELPSKVPDVRSDVAFHCSVPGERVRCGPRTKSLPIGSPDRGVW